jgi:TRAP-type C4-dicarboxylate transport system permease small subunit
MERSGESTNKIQASSGFEKFLDAISNKIFMWISIAALAVMMFWGAFDVLGRFLFNKPIQGTIEVYQILLPVMALLGIGMAQRADAHIRVDLIFIRLPLKLQRILIPVIDSWAFLLFAVICWRGILATISYYQQGRLISHILVPFYLVQLLVPIGAFAMCLVLVGDLSRAWKNIRRPEA